VRAASWRWKASRETCLSPPADPHVVFLTKFAAAAKAPSCRASTALFVRPRDADRGEDGHCKVRMFFRDETGPADAAPRERLKPTPEEAVVPPSSKSPPAPPPCARVASHRSTVAANGSPSPRWHLKPVDRVGATGTAAIQGIHPGVRDQRGELHRACHRLQYRRHYLTRLSNSGREIPHTGRLKRVHHIG